MLDEGGGLERGALHYFKKPVPRRAQGGRRLNGHEIKGKAAGRNAAKKRKRTTRESRERFNYTFGLKVFLPG